MSRNAMLSQIHIAKKDLALDDETYRLMLERLTGKRSCRDLTDRQLTLVLGSLRRQGWDGEAPGRTGHRRPKAKPACVRLMGKIEALLTEAKRPWTYAASLAQRMYRVDSLEWCDREQLRGIVAALSKDAARRRGKEAS